LEKELASLRHLFPAKNPPATPRRRATRVHRFKDFCAFVGWISRRRNPTGFVGLRFANPTKYSL
jgi:hypothetical protein